MSLIDHWPLFGLRIVTPVLELRIPSDQDLAEILKVAKAGIHDPAFMPFTIPWTDSPSPQLEREALKYWWRGRSNFSKESWDLTFAVVYSGEIVGAQNLTASDFPRQRSAETGSWLGLQYQGRGIGKEMRRAVLELAFVSLEAQEVTSTAFVDNDASRRVSIAVGYEPNGSGVAKRRAGTGEQIRFRITRDRWLETRPAEFNVSVWGFDRCRDLFV